MAGQRQPINLLVEKGKKHLTKAEIAERQKTEVKAPSDKVTAPAYLTPEQKKTFKKIVKELRAIGLISNLDVDALARLVIAQDNYLKITKEMEQQEVMIEVEVKEEDGIIRTVKAVNQNVERLANLQNKYFKQCRQGAADFGMTVSSRCRLVMPKAEPEKKENKFAKFA